jgi:small multidrug resistance pump
MRTAFGTLVPIMGWLLLSVAIVTEVAATLSLRSAGEGDRLALTVVVLGYGASLALLAFVVKYLDVSIAYAVWSGVGTAAVAFFGVTMLGEPATALKVASIVLIVAGVVGLNLTGAH